MTRFEAKKGFMILLVFILQMIKPLQSQHFQPFETNIANYLPVPYDSTNTSYRTFSCKGSLNSMSVNSSFVFSILSFNYFVREAFCEKPVRNYTSFETIISCSPNVYKLSFMYFDKGPNIFVLYQERVYKEDKIGIDLVDVTKWMKSAAFPLKSLVRNRYLFILSSPSKQYEVKAQTFITGVSMFRDTTLLNGVGKVKLDAIYRYVTIDDESKLWVPIAINVSTSRTVQKVSFYTLIVIKEMVSLNMNFQTISFEKQSDVLNLGSFAGISQMSFFVPNQTISGYQSLGLNVSYNYTTPYLNISALIQRFSQEKIFNYSRGQNLNLKMTKLTELFYRRCTNSNLYHYYAPDIPKEGKYYKIRPAFTPGLVWEVASDGKIKLAKQTNSLSQVFYFIHRATVGIRETLIFNAATKQQIRCQTLNINDTLKMGPMGDEFDFKGVWSLWILINNNATAYYFECKANSMRLGLMNSTVLEGIPLIQTRGSSVLLSQQFSVSQVDVSNPTSVTNTTMNNSVILPYKKNSNFFLSYLWSSSNSSSSNPYFYYSIEEETCYDKTTLDARLANTSLNNYNLSNFTSVLPYFMDVNRNLSQETILRNTNISTINTSTAAFAQGYMYGFCINRVTLNNFFTQINQGWTGFAVENLTSIIGVDSNYTKNYSLPINSNKTDEKPLILMPNGCQKMKIINITSLKYECQVCQENYIIFQEEISGKNLSQSFNPKKCICQVGYFMNSTGQCTLCSFHPTNCKPQISLAASLINSVTKLSYTESRTLLITLQIINDKYFYSFKNSVEKILSSIFVRINGQNYTILSGNVNKCNEDKLTGSNLSLCLDIRVENVSKAEEYRLSIGTNVLSDDLIDSYLLINETQILSETTHQKTSQAFYKVGLNDTLSNQASILSTQTTSKIYFSKLQTFQIIVHEPYTVQRFVDSIEPVFLYINTSSSVVMLAAPFLMDKINIFSILQTNSLLYMMSFLKFNQINGKRNEIQAVAQKLFIFRPQPYIKFFSLKTENIDGNEISYIQIPRYSTQFQIDSIFSSDQQNSLSYPSVLYTEAIPSLNFESGSQNYFSLTLNALINMGIQILIMETLFFLISTFCSTIKENESLTVGNQEKRETIKKKIEYEIIRHKFVDLLKQVVEKNWKYKEVFCVNQRYHFMLQKPIEWQSMPKIQQSEKIRIEEKSLEQTKIQQNQHHEPENEQEEIEETEQKNNEPTVKQNLLFIVTGIKQKRYIFYSSFLMIQLISQTYLLYFELIKPLDPNSNDITSNTLNFIDMIFSLMMMFIIMVFPVLLANQEPLNLLKIVAVISKFGGYKFSHTKYSQQESDSQNKNKSLQKLFIQKSYFYGEIYLYFCIIYYEVIFITFSIAIGPSVFYQSLPIAIYQIFKFVWMYKRLKVLDKLKTIVLCIIFILSATWDFIEDQSFRTDIIENSIIVGMYFVLSIEIAKLLKFLIVFIMKSLKLKTTIDTKDKQNNQSLHSKKLVKQKPSQKNEISIIDIQEEPTQNQTNLMKEIPQFQSESLMIENKKKKLESLKKKQVMLKEITKTREILQQNLKILKNRRKNVAGQSQKIQNN